MGRVRKFARRIGQAWNVFIHGPRAVQSGFGGALEAMTKSEAYSAALWSMRKVENQPRLKAAPQALQRREASEWAMTYARETYASRPTAWEIGLCVELAIGLESGRLPRP